MKLLLILWTGLVLAAPAGSGGSDEPRQDLTPYLGSWVSRELKETPHGSYEVEHHLLLRETRAGLRWKTYEVVPDLKARGKESDWKGRTRVDQWNTTSLNLSPGEGTALVLSFNGTNGVGSNTEGHWWAAGHLEPGERDGRPILRMLTTSGLVPSSKGNIWRPLDRTYELLSRDIAPQFLPRRDR